MSLATAGGALAQQIDERTARAACQDDAFRLCQATIPDRERTLNCLITYKDYLSPACRTVLADLIPPEQPQKKKKQRQRQQSGGPVDLSPTRTR